ncbi:MAG: aerial mycelium formation protein [Acidimicrobiales bacterium]
MTPELDLVTEQSFVADLTGRDMDELRAMRTRCQSLENSLSYVRRLIQGRLDIVGGESQRRREGGESGNTSELIGRLPDILSEGSRVQGGPGAVRPPQSMEPDAAVTAALEERLEQVVSSEDLGKVADLSDDDLSSATAGLTELEDEVSTSRRSIHSVIDTLQAEVTRRYQVGEASVDGLLST